MVETTVRRRNPGPEILETAMPFKRWRMGRCTGGNITVANDWTKGVVDSLALPATLDNPGTTSVYLRWVMTSNKSTAADSADVLSTGISKIDDIVVTGTLSGVGISTVIYENNVSCIQTHAVMCFTLNQQKALLKLKYTICSEHRYFQQIKNLKTSTSMLKILIRDYIL